MLDFGLAKQLVARGVSEAVTPSGATLDSDPNLTSPGMALGTVGYMSPEQVRGESLDGRSDLFSLGLVLYEMATGRQAFAGNTSGVIFHAILERQPAPPSQLNPDLPAAFDASLRKPGEKSQAALSARLGPGRGFAAAEARHGFGIGGARLRQGGGSRSSER